jgi:hypothetical protein
MVSEKNPVNNLIQSVVGFLGSLLLYIVPRRLLENWVSKLISRHYNAACKTPIFYKSGRSALTALFQKIKEINPSAVVLLPDYICNVVYAAAHFSGLQIKTYPTNELFQPDFNCLAAIIANEKIDAVLLASIFGNPIDHTNALAKIRPYAPDIIIIFDECQNLITGSQVSLDKASVVVLSFNKTILGALGGALYFENNFLKISSPKFHFKKDIKLEILILGTYARQFLKSFKRSFCMFTGRKIYFPIPVLEYTYGKNQYSLDVQIIAKISLIRAMIGLLQIHKIENNRSQNFVLFNKLFNKSLQNNLIKTRCCESSLYVPFYFDDQSLIGELALKGPYAVDGKPEISFREKVYAIINEGACLYYENFHSA